MFAGRVETMLPKKYGKPGETALPLRKIAGLHGSTAPPQRLSPSKYLSLYAPSISLYNRLRNPDINFKKTVTQSFKIIQKSENST